MSAGAKYLQEVSGYFVVKGNEPNAYTGLA